MIKFEEVNYNEVKRATKRERVYRELFEDFLQSGKACVKVTEHNCANNSTFLANVTSAIKKYRYTNVKAVYRSGEVYLINTQLQGADDNETV